MMTEAHPLHWPEGWPRTRLRERSRFMVNLGTAILGVRHEVGLLGGTQLVISTNLPVRRDGLPYASRTLKPGEDPGAAVYFLLAGKQRVFACDRWAAVKDNLRSIGETIEALRGIERWGASDMLDRALSAFVMLPPPRSWREVLEMQDNVTGSNDSDLSAAKFQHRRLAKQHHPDTGDGDTEKLLEVTSAWEAAQQELQEQSHQ